MKKNIFTLLLLLFFSPVFLLADDMPNLTVRENLTQNLHAGQTFSITDAKDILKLTFPAQSPEYSLEVKATVTSAAGRGLDIEARNNGGKGFRTTLGTGNFSWSPSLASMQTLSNSDNSEEQTFRFAVKDGQVHIYQNGLYLTSKSLANIKDIQDDGTETDVTMVYGNDVIGTWSGTAVLPTSLGWSGSTTSIPWAVSGGGVRYENVTHNMDGGGNYTGTLLTVRWDNNAYSSATYFYPVTLEANTSYEFSFLYEWWANSSGVQTLTTGISTSTNASNIYDSQVNSTASTAQTLKSGKFVFTSKEAGLHYLTFNGSFAMFGIGDLSLKKVTVDSHLIFGKNYPTGAVNMQVASITFDEGAYAPQAQEGSLNQVITEETYTTTSFVNKNVTVPGKSDVHVTGSEPFNNSTINLQSDNSWLFFDNIRPETVIANWLDYVKVNGVAASNAVNVRIAIYGNGTVIIPNGPSFNSKALTVYKGANFTGDSQNYAIQNRYNSLGAFDNAIKSFKLKRGYIATFANNSDGTGYSRVFIADDADIEINMPDVLNETVSFIRVMKWEWPSKKGWCGTGSGGRTDSEKVQGTWFYTWSADNYSTNNMEYVPIKQKINWPSWGDINGKTNVSHVLGYNEPNRPDQSNMTVEDALSAWPEYQATGLRLGSPSPSDPFGSNGAWLYNFLDSCDARGYRVDYVAIHCYWTKTPSQWYSDLKYVYDKVKRPLWITEWNNGANWTSETWPDSDRGYTTANAAKQLNDLKAILNVLDTCSFVERYSIYNWVQDCRAMLLNGNLTSAGQYYKDNKSKLAYNPAREAVPVWKVPTLSLSHRILADNERVTLTWNNVRDELIGSYVIERKLSGESNFTPIDTIKSYTTVTYTTALYHNAQYRVRTNAKINSTYTNTNVVTVEKDFLVDPATLNGEVLSTSIIDISWTDMPKARTYNLKRSKNAEGPYTTIRTLDYGTTYYRDENLEENTNYFYKISSVNYAGEGTDSQALPLKTNELLVPGAVEGTLVSSADTKVTLIWDHMYDARFKVIRSESATGPFEELQTNIDSLRFVDKNVVNGKKYYYQVKAFNEKGESAVENVVEATPAQGLHAYFTFNETSGDKAYDSWGGFHGNLMSNSIRRRSGKYGHSVVLDGSENSYIQLPNNIVSDLTGNFTIMTWMFFSSVDQNTRVFDFGNGTGNFMMLSPNVGNNTIRYKLVINGTENVFDQVYEFPTERWIHITLRRSGVLLYLYVNGEQIGRSSAMGLTPASLGSTTRNYIGKSQWGTDPVLNGRVDDFRIYNYALSPADIVAAKDNTFLPPVSVQPVTSDPNAELILYPNPVKDVLHISLSDESPLHEVELYTISGQKIYSRKLNFVSDTTIDLSVFPEGLYILKLRTADRNISRQILKR